MRQGQVTRLGDRQALLVAVETPSARAVPAVELVVDEDDRKAESGCEHGSCAGSEFRDGHSEPLTSLITPLVRTCVQYCGEGTSG
jgi:hypothetical protein